MARKLLRIWPACLIVFGTFFITVDGTHQDPNKNAGAPFGYIEMVDKFQKQASATEALLMKMYDDAIVTVASAQDNIDSAIDFPIGQATFPSEKNRPSDYVDQLEPAIEKLISTGNRLRDDAFTAKKELTRLVGLLVDMDRRVIATPDHP